mmetsp:Transcript_46088/g.112563  ORF Transcript_46088/g.112563 Transcript_46088/m.112563 type:complete len:541 (+) Transcript_46088:94-1716(+)
MKSTTWNRASSNDESVMSVTTNNTSGSLQRYDGQPLDTDEDEQLFFVTSYSDFNSLAHGPKGTEASKSIYVYRFHPNDGSMLLLNVHGDSTDVPNPAFSRYHPRLSIVYCCTEDCNNNGKIFAYKIGVEGALEQFGEPVDAGGTSTCYLTISKDQKNLLVVNYWNSTLCVIGLDYQTGAMGHAIKSTYDPKGGKEMVACLKAAGGANHSCNDEATIKARQADPHSHALVLDPYVGRVAYVPCLGKDVIREFYYDAHNGAIGLELNTLPPGLGGDRPDGPRYFEFHPKYNVAYVVNEFSCTVAVFEVDRNLLQEIYVASKRGEDMTKFKGRSTLRLIQSISTLPSAFPTEMNTCGRIAVHKTGKFVIVSNRGHQSITVFRVKTTGRNKGKLVQVGIFHTRGECPRHWTFDDSGSWLLVANQDSDNLKVFSFNLSSGELKYTGNEYRVLSPNFVCSVPPHQWDESELPTVVSEGNLISRNHTMTRFESSDTDGSYPSDSEESSKTPNVWDCDKTSEQILQDELAHARNEIADLKKLLLEKAS